MKAKNDKDSVLLVVVFFFSFALLVIAIRAPVEEFLNLIGCCILIFIAALFFMGGMLMLIRGEIRSVIEDKLLKTPPNK